MNERFTPMSLRKPHICRRNGLWRAYIPGGSYVAHILARSVFEELYRIWPEPPGKPNYKSRPVA
jgi:hypothetical protein